jgi:putative phage-type endonuclease
MPLNLPTNTCLPSQAKQGSAEWFQARCGKITASRIRDLMKIIKSGESAERKRYRLELLTERLTGLQHEHYVSRRMERGIELEDEARKAYSRATGSVVDQVGFIEHPRLTFSGASPDGLIDEDGGLEIKVPDTTTHIQWIMGAEVPPEHVDQMQWGMACSERIYWDFMSYDPRMLDPNLQRFIKRLNRDDKRIAEIEKEVARFDEEIRAVIEYMKKGPLESSLDLLRKSVK